MQVEYEAFIDFKTDIIKAYKDILGWQVYGTNTPFNNFDTAKIIETYKEEYQVEYRFDQLHNKTAALMPIFLQKDERIKALIRLLMIPIKILSLIQFKARQALKNTQSQVNELFPSPARNTNQPITEMILRAFLNVFLVVLVINKDNLHIEVSTLSKSQLKLLRSCLSYSFEVEMKLIFIKLGFNFLNISGYTFEKFKFELVKINSFMPKKIIQTASKFSNA